MPSTSRATSAFAANTLLLLAMGSWAGAASYVKVAKGCYSSSQPLKDLGTWTYQSSGYCQTQCEKQNAPVFAMSDGDHCWCGSLLPAANTKVSDSSCDTPCQGYPQEMCGGGSDYYTVWLTGQDTSVGSYGGSSDTSSESSESSTSTIPTTTSTSTTATTRPHRTTHRPQVVTSVKPGTTVVVTQPPAAESSSSSQSTSSSGSSTNVAGIAAGVVVGIVAAASIVTGIYFWLRHRRRQSAENEYKRTQVADFMRGGSEMKPPPTGYSSTSDSRLDPEAGKRNSQGSIADDQDYSRRILRVANPDNS